MAVSWNIEWVKSRTKAEFIKAFKHVYPKLDLSKEYDQIVKKKK